MKKKKITLLLFILILVTGCKKNPTPEVKELFDPYNIPEEVNVTCNTQDYEVYSDIHTEDLIIANNAVITNHETLFYEELGTYTKTFELAYNDKVYKKDCSFNIVDTTSPIFISAATTRYVLVNSSDDLCNGIAYGDIYDNTPSCVVSGDYNLNKLGTYTITYSITDQSGNVNTKNTTLKVVNKIPTSSSNGQARIQFSDMIAKHKNENTLVGIDVSRWQGNINFEKVKAAGADFVMMRMAVSSDFDKEISLDSYFKTNIVNAKAAGLKVGVYIYSSAINEEQAREHARYALNNLNGTELDFPIAYDWENWSKFSKYKTSIYNISNAFNAFADEINSNGYQTMLYGSKNYLENIWINRNNYPVWLAHYVNSTTYTGDYIMWQLGNTGRIDGINGDVDIDIYYINKAGN